MKPLNELTPEEKTRLLAEVDEPDAWVIMKRGLYYRPQAHGYTSCLCDAWKCSHEEAKKHEYLRGDEPVTIKPAPPKDYTSYDAMIPLIQKLDDKTKVLIGQLLPKFGINFLGNVYDITPSQLSNVVLVAAGKATI